MALCGRFNIPADDAEGMFDQLYYEYADWDRHYHNLSHLQSLLRVLDTYKEYLENKDLVEMAIWFHDYIYNTKRKDNEEESAAQAAAWLQNYLSDETTTHIEQLILSTSGHEPRIDHPDCRYFLDFDLSILATDRQTYKAYSDAIAKEYSSWFSFLFYKNGRKQVLWRFWTANSCFLPKNFLNNMNKRPVITLSGR